MQAVRVQGVAKFKVSNLQIAMLEVITCDHFGCTVYLMHVEPSELCTGQQQVGQGSQATVEPKRSHKHIYKAHISSCLTTSGLFD